MGPNRLCLKVTECRKATNGCDIMLLLMKVHKKHQDFLFGRSVSKTFRRRTIFI